MRSSIPPNLTPRSQSVASSRNENAHADRTDAAPSSAVHLEISEASPMLQGKPLLGLSATDAGLVSMHVTDHPQEDPATRKRERAEIFGRLRVEIPKILTCLDGRPVDWSTPAHKIAPAVHVATPALKKALGSNHWFTLPKITGPLKAGFRLGTSGF